MNSPINYGQTEMQGNAALMGGNAGNQASYGTGDVMSVAKQLTQDPNKQAQIAQILNSQQQQEQAGLALQSQAAGAGIGNAVSNANAARQMAIASQANAAQNVANQLQQLGQARQTSANLIGQALSSGASLAR